MPRTVGGVVCSKENEELMIDLKLPVFLVALFVLSGCAEQSCTGSCQVSVESDHQMYRYRLDGGNGILEKREVSGGSWNGASEKPILDGFEVASVLGINDKILVSHCDVSGNRRMLKFDPQDESWSATYFQTGGCL